MTPLSQLFKNEDACKQVFQAITGFTPLRITSTQGNGVGMSDGINNVIINGNGSILAPIGTNHFAVVDKIRELGYEP